MQAKPLVQSRGRWVALNHADLAEAAAAWPSEQTPLNSPAQDAPPHSASKAQALLAELVWQAPAGK